MSWLGLFLSEISILDFSFISILDTKGLMSNALPAIKNGCQVCMALYLDRLRCYLNIMVLCLSYGVAYEQ